MSNRESTPATDIVPDGYRTKPLPDEVRDRVEEVANNLAQLSYRHINNDGQDAVDYHDEKDQTLDEKPWKWFVSGSERDVAHLGRTYMGEYIYSDEIGVVIKFNPSLKGNDWRIDDDGSVKQMQTIRASGNLHEIAVWKHATDFGNTNLFAEILDYSDCGHWIAQRYCTPVFLSYPSMTQYSTSIDYICEAAVDRSLSKDFREKANEVGYDPHMSSGNLGIHPDTGDTVCIDFGSHFDIGIDDEVLMEACVENIKP